MNTVYLVANGDLRLSANQMCEPAQAAMEKALVEAIQREGFTVKRAHPFDEKKRHGFIDSQKMGIEVFRSIPKDAPVVVAESVWQYSQHVLPGLFAHEGPLLTVANWSGTWPGLVGLLNLNAGLTKAGVKYSSLWSEEFRDKFFVKKLRQWLASDKINHDASHVMKYKEVKIPGEPRRLGERLASALREQQSILGVFDEGCMGMYNAIVPDELASPLGIFKERLSQSTLYARMLTIPDEEARQVYDWLINKGVKFHYGPNEETDLTEPQVIQQCKMYIAAVRLAAEFGCATIGIQYQQGLKDLCPASDLVEGILNNSDRPPVRDQVTGEELYPNQPLPVFNEVDECAGIDALITNRVWKELKQPPETTLHDLRWGRHYQDDNLDAYIWVFLISGGAPPAHFIDGYSGTSSERQPPMYFRLGGGTCKGVSRPGWIVWSRVFIDDGELCFDTGIGEVVKLPDHETEDRWRLTTPQWPIMHAVLHGITRDQMMARHKSNHIQVAYTTDRASARTAMFAKAATMAELGLKVYFCGEF
ncbi:MAG: fucose isomerase [Verrucomicrobia bacterium]|nr:fucose isomerase [Verrucomicrobiota bacterium]MBV9274186.1 fucose isomerase [Verrucomicrobiota bacterium]